MALVHPHGWIILDKPIGLGSTQAVGAVKRVCREAGIFERFGKLRVGHGGTLDPLASGVLPIALGEATKLAGRMLDASKEYEFTVQFGEETDTLDLEGRVIAQSDVRPSLAEVEAVLGRFTGEIEQVPPAYSALMVDGARAYDRARAGEAVEMPARRVTVYCAQTPPRNGEGDRRRGRWWRGHALGSTPPPCCAWSPSPFRGGSGCCHTRAHGLQRHLHPQPRA